MIRRIWMLWLQGWAEAPPVAQASRRSFEQMNPGWTLRALDAESYGGLLDGRYEWVLDLRDQIPAAAFSDLIRICLLHRFGGLWADATVMCARPLDEWLPVYGADDLFAFRNPGPDRALSTWFMYAPVGSRLVEAWMERCRGYWAHHDQPDEYHWFHYEFNELLDSDPEIARRWTSLPALSADPPHTLLPHHRSLNRPPTGDEVSLYVGDQAPVLKLSHKFELTSEPGTNYSLATTPDRRLMMHRVPKFAPSPVLDGLRIAIQNEGLVTPVETLRAEAVANDVDVCGATVLSASEPLDPASVDVIIDVAESRSSAPAVSVDKPRIALRPFGEVVRSEMFWMATSGGYINYADPALLAPLQRCSPHRLNMTAAIVGVQNNEQVVAIERALHSMRLATETVGADELVAPGICQRLAIYRLLVAAETDAVVLGLRAQVPVISFQPDTAGPDLTLVGPRLVVRSSDTDELRLATQEALRLGAAQLQHDRAYRRAELTMAALRSLIARIVAGRTG